MMAAPLPSPAYLDGTRIMVGAGRDIRTPREALLDAVREYVGEWGNGPEVVAKLVDRADRLPENQRREILRLGVLAAIEACGSKEPAAAPTDRPHAPAGHVTKDKASWTPPASAGSGVAARLAVVAPAYDWAQLPNGAQLVEANVADLENAIEVHSRTAKRAVAEVKMLASIKAEMQRKRVGRVGDIFTVDQLKRLREEAGLD